MGFEVKVLVIFLFLLGLYQIPSVLTILVQDEDDPEFCASHIEVEIQNATPIEMIPGIPKAQNKSESDLNNQNKSGAEMTLLLRFVAFMMTFLVCSCIYGFFWALYANRKMIALVTRTAFFGISQKRGRDGDLDRLQGGDRTPSQTEKGIDEVEEQLEMKILTLTPTPISSVISFEKMPSLPGVQEGNEDEDENELERIQKILNTLENPCTSATARQLWDEISLSPPTSVIYL